VDCLQLDVTRCGGITEFQRGSALAAAHNLQVSGHCAPNRALRDGAVGPGEFAAVRSALRDPSFSFVDALSVAASGRL